MILNFVVPAFKAKDSLDECLRSIRDQNGYENSKIVVVINGPDDGSKNIADKFNAQVLFGPRPNRGLARNIGASHCESDWIAFVDADVKLDPDWTRTILDRVGKSFVGAAQGKIIPTSIRKNRLQDLREELWNHRQGEHGTHLFKLGQLTPYLNSAACMVSRSAFQKIEGFDVNLIRHQDVDLGLRIVKEGYPLCFIPNAEARVYFNGSLTDYFLRAFNVGFHRHKLIKKWLPSSKKETKLSFRSLDSSLSFFAKLEEKLQHLGEIIGQLSNDKNVLHSNSNFQKIIIGSEKSLLITSEGKALWIELDTHHYLESKAGLNKTAYPKEWMDACEEALIKKGYIP